LSVSLILSHLNEPKKNFNKFLLWTLFFLKLQLLFYMKIQNTKNSVVPGQKGYSTQKKNLPHKKRTDHTKQKFLKQMIKKNFFVWSILVIIRVPPYDLFFVCSVPHIQRVPPLQKLEKN
jgi:hypothetical protein